MERKSKIYLAGHTGLVGSALYKKLLKDYDNIIVRDFSELDLRNQQNVENFFAEERPEYVIMAAAKVGGILANYNFPADFIYDNLMIEANLIHASYKFGVKKLLFLGSSCIYPKNCPQPMKEEYLLSGYLEHTNQPYAIAKIAGIELCKSFNRQYNSNFISCMPTNLYGPNDNFDLESSHVIPALIAKICQAKIDNADSVIIWGTGAVRREFLFVDDLADAIIFLMKNYNKSELINVGTGTDITIADLADLIRNLVGFNGELKFDSTKPDGVKQKLLDIARISDLGWRPKYNLVQGLEATISWYFENKQKIANLCAAN